MPADEITQRHLQKLRIRGAPSTIPGTVGSVGSYEAEETWRQTARALVTPLDKHLTAASLNEAFERLAAVAAAEKLSVVEDPLFALKGDPTEDPPYKWEYEAVLPIRGAGKGSDGVAIARVQGGMHIFTVTPRGLPDLKNVYTYLFGKFMPAKKQQLMRPYLLHRVLEGLPAFRERGSTSKPFQDGGSAPKRFQDDGGSAPKRFQDDGGSAPKPLAHDDALTIAVYVPAVLSIKPVAVPGEGGEA